MCSHALFSTSFFYIYKLITDFCDWTLLPQKQEKNFRNPFVVLAASLGEIMEDSTSAAPHNERKRSSDSNAFAKFLPFSPPLEHDPESHEAQFGGPNDHGHKRLKPNSQAPFLETTTTTLTPSSHLPEQNIDTKQRFDFSSPSTSIKRSASSGPSPQSIGSKSSLIEYVENDAKICRTVSDGEF